MVIEILLRESERKGTISLAIGRVSIGSRPV
jgi:hypothetical protein